MRLLLLLAVSLFTALSSACRGDDPICEDPLDSDCSHGCRCPAEHFCIQFSSKVGNTGSNSCSKNCAQQSDCPADTRCVEVIYGGTAAPEIHGECRPECTVERYCRGSTTCHDTQIYLGGAPIHACY